MSLKERVDKDIKEAMRSKDQAALRATRAVKSEILLAEREGAKKEIDEAREIEIIQKLIKQRRDSLEIYEKEGREDLAKKEREEIEVIEKYLPAQLSKDELRELINEIIQQTGAMGMQDMGRVMGVARDRIAGRADNKSIAEMVKEQLQMR